ncbi:MAG: amidohydrolase family protein, partial [Gemmatimonadetes bacterium]|nr:amidohydrolase family protein [Gemmatimonadota bacterium]
QALCAALADGTIDCIATDHAPRHYDEKEQAFDDAPFGAVGFETTFAVLHTRLVVTGQLELATLIERMSTGPRTALGLARGTLQPGEPADIVLLDPEARWTIDPEAFLSKCRNTPFAGKQVTGKVVRTLVGGRTVWEASGSPRAGSAP